MDRISRLLQRQASVYDEGWGSVGASARTQHLVTFYRNTAIHILVSRAVAELALLAAAGDHNKQPVSPATVRDEALSLRDFAEVRVLVFLAVLSLKKTSQTVLLIGWSTPPSPRRSDVWRLLEIDDVLLAHLVLRPFLGCLPHCRRVWPPHEDDSFGERKGFWPSVWNSDRSSGSCGAISPAPGQVDGAVQGCTGSPSQARSTDDYRSTSLHRPLGFKPTR